MKKILNKKGFTLVELLAVIIVLSIVMIIATRSIISEMNKANGRAAIVQGEALRREVNNACMLNGTVTMSEIEGLVAQDKIFKESESSNKVNKSASGKGFTIGLKGTKFSTIISPAQTDADKVKILKLLVDAEGNPILDANNEKQYVVDTDRGTVEDGRLYIGIDCVIN